jgi:hypothetical protein
VCCDNGVVCRRAYVPTSGAQRLFDHPVHTLYTNTHARGIYRSSLYLYERLAMPVILHSKKISTVYFTNCNTRTPQFKQSLCWHRFINSHMFQVTFTGLENPNVGVRVVTYCIFYILDLIPVGARFFAHVQTGPGAHPASCTIGT